jgi:hypothetical protein
VEIWDKAQGGGLFLAMTDHGLFEVFVAKDRTVEEAFFVIRQNTFPLLDFNGQRFIGIENAGARSIDAVCPCLAKLETKVPLEGQFQHAINLSKAACSAVDKAKHQEESQKRCVLRLSVASVAFHAGLMIGMTGQGGLGGVSP